MRHAQRAEHQARHRSLAGGGGFTLVEVLVALAITAMALAAGLKAAGALTDNAQRLGDVTAAHGCADNALVGLRLAQQFPGTGEAEFSCNQLGRDFRGLLRTQTTPNPNFRRIDAVVLDPQGHVLATLSTVLGRY
jgi:general secretion pathway protein I